jgi:RHS repeat-associated protein
MTLRYHNPVKSTSSPSYTGNIAEWVWTHKGTGADNTANTYSFAYDYLSRLTDSRRYTGTSTTPTNAFSERNLTYDKNGNILTLKRYGTSATTAVDDLTDATYNGNQLSSIENNGTTRTYDYDSNGNMTTDGLNSLEFNYNYLNLLAEARDSSDDLVAKYTFLADGTKVGVVDDGGHGLEYTGSLIYRRNGTSLELESTSFGGGRIEVSEGTSGNIYTPNYFITDHLGSTRAVVTPNGTIRERNDYHPFGLRWSNANTQVSDNRFRFSGKENQTTGNLPYQDFGARFFGGKLPIFTTPDPLSNVRPWESTYVYCGNNPVVRTDTDGRIWDIVWDLGNVVYDVGAAVVNHIKGYHDKAKSHWADAGLDVGAAFIPFVPAGASKVVKGIDIIADGAKTVDKVTDAAKTVDKSTDGAKALNGGDNLLQEGNKLPDTEIAGPPAKRGNAPIGTDGKPVELHHRNQTTNSPVDEMTRTNHRGAGNFKKNHANTGQEKSLIDRSEFNQQRKEYWKKEWDSGRFGNQ